MFVPAILYVNTLPGCFCTVDSISTTVLVEAVLLLVTPIPFNKSFYLILPHSLRLTIVINSAQGVVEGLFTIYNLASLSRKTRKTY